MNLMCQKQALEQLQRIADADNHSVLIEGIKGCGKTYLAAQFAKMKHIEDYTVVDSTVNSIKDMIERSYSLTNNMIMCVENLDIGVAAAAFTLLKYLEEPKSNVYIVVTCRNINNVPDTILSRSVSVTVAPPIDSDIITYAMTKDMTRLQILKGLPLWKVVRSFQDVDMLFLLTPEKVDYLTGLNRMKLSNHVSDIIWQMGHYLDNSETDLDFVVRYIMLSTNSKYMKQCCIECLTELSYNRIASHATLAKLAFELKYGGY